LVYETTQLVVVDAGVGDGTQFADEDSAAVGASTETNISLAGTGRSA
jgi:hypothetical protein